MAAHRERPSAPGHDIHLEGIEGSVTLACGYSVSGYPLPYVIRTLTILQEDLTSDDSSNGSHKRLPTTPPFSDSPEEGLTPRPSITHSNTSIVSSRRGTESSSESSPSSLSAAEQSMAQTTVSSLASLKDLIANAETALYKQLGRSSLDELGGIRRAFITSASDTYQRLQSGLPPGLEGALPDILPTLPEWWKPRTHCLPNSSVIVRESEWGSIIAFTLR